jgi:dTDP-4-dehydrorhamnose 3,5-epimerase
MGWLTTEFEGLWIYEPKVFGDSRGYFMESFNESTLSDTDIQTTFVQDNEAKSSKGVLRGLHYQVGKNAQSKLVRVITGEVLDVVVDIRPSSRTYGQHFSIVLNDVNKFQLFVPKGFAHGYVVLSDEAIFVYKCDTFYSKSDEAGIKYNDSTLNIDWVLPRECLLLSEKDLLQPEFGNHKIFHL